MRGLSGQAPKDIGHEFFKLGMVQGSDGGSCLALLAGATSGSALEQPGDIKWRFGADV